VGTTFWWTLDSSEDAGKSAYSLRRAGIFHVSYLESKSICDDCLLPLLSAS
jgi:hypothetical protein